MKESISDQLFVVAKAEAPYTAMPQIVRQGNTTKQAAESANLLTGNGVEART
jgi:hypothetical protein